MAFAGETLLAYSGPTKRLFLINYEQDDVTEFDSKDIINGIRASPDFDAKKHPIFYARSKKSILVINSETKEMTQVLKVNGSNTLESTLEIV